MQDTDLLNQIINKIALSKGYTNLPRETISRVAHLLVDKYPQRELPKEIKNKLHQIWGAFYDGNPNFDKILTKFSEIKDNQAEIKHVLTQINQLHSSTGERLAIIPDIYEQIFKICKSSKSITEYGCGLNALSLILSDFEKKYKYIGYDIDQKEVEFLNKVFEELGLSNFQAKYGDIFTQELPKSDIALLLKLLPTIEQQQKGISLEILNKLPNKWIVVSFPVFSIGKKAKNMTEFYTTWLEELLPKLQFKTSVVKLEFKTELVFVVCKI